MKSREIQVKDLIIGGDNPVVIQSMSTFPPVESAKLIDEINRLADAGAQLVRFSVRNLKDAACLPDIIKNTDIALCGDIHFDYRIALACVEKGIHKIRLNPGNIGSADNVKEVVKAAQERGVPIRIGVNGGSIDRKKFGKPTPDALVASAREHIDILEKLDYHKIIVSIKSSDVRTVVAANRMMSTHYDYPLHLGVTEAGFGTGAMIKSAIGIGALLLDGIGSTIRVSITGDPLQEIYAAKEILKNLNLLNYGITIVSCPTCGRTDPDVDLESIASSLKSDLEAKYLKKLEQKSQKIEVAVMGCEVNGPGEAQDADVGIAGAGHGKFLLFVKGEKVKKISKADVNQEVCTVIDNMVE